MSASESISCVVDGTTRDVLRDVKDDPDRWAVFLDIDGTLLELALTPDAIVVPPSLAQDLGRLHTRLRGAMALVTGRALGYADQLFAPYRFPLAGLHGAEIRDCAGNLSLARITKEFEALKTAIAREAESMPGVLVEDKGAAVAAHYRLAPDYEQVLAERMQQYARDAGLAGPCSSARWCSRSDPPGRARAMRWSFSCNKTRSPIDAPWRSAMTSRMNRCFRRSTRAAVTPSGSEISQHRHVPPVGRHRLSSCGRRSPRSWPAVLERKHHCADESVWRNE